MKRNNQGGNFTDEYYGAVDCNFKSIQCLTMHNMEQALILVGKNSTGKTVVLDAILAVTGNYEIQDSDFAPEGQNIEISMTLDIPEEELHPVAAGHCEQIQAL